jgi:hypothetical protein
MNRGESRRIRLGKWRGEAENIKVAIVRTA